ncbi:hypothetical protein ONZ45_g10977 [Pleurotus djamor]|nr:hypothetical protein ONZ45_g10977 [Pleurotus djamor]
MASSSPSTTKTTSSVRDIAANDPPFGSRFLNDESQVWSHNAWDHVPPPDDQAEKIVQSLTRQRANPVPLEDQPKYNDKPAKHWDNFYKANAGNFFRNRKWLSNEFPELIEATKIDAGSKVIVEVGCGAGNAVFPLLSINENPHLTIHAYDYSSHAVKVVQLLKPGGLVLLRDYGRHDLTQLRFKNGRMLDENFYIRGDKTRVYFFELDELALLFTGSRAGGIAHSTETTEFVDDGDTGTDSPGSASQGSSTVVNISESQPTPTTSPKNPSIPSDQHSAVPLSEPVSSSVDDTTSTAIATTTTITPVIHINLLTPPQDLPPQPLFTIEQLGVDRRLLVNRKRMLKMYRVWMQGKFRKI